MKTRLLQIIEYVAEGKQYLFAEQMGWSTQYVHNMIKTESVGLKPLSAILRKYPEINARWLILGEGAMLDDVSKRVRDLLGLLLSIENEKSEIPASSIRGISEELSLTLSRLEGYLEAVNKR